VGAGAGGRGLRAAHAGRAVPHALAAAQRRRALGARRRPRPALGSRACGAAVAGAARGAAWADGQDAAWQAFCAKGAPACCVRWLAGQATALHRASAAPHPRRPVPTQHRQAVIEQGIESAAGAAEGGRAAAAGAAGAAHHARPGPGRAVEQRRGPGCAPRHRPALARTSGNAQRHEQLCRACWSMRQASVWRLRRLGLRLSRKQQDRLRALPSCKTHASDHSADQQCLAHAFLLISRAARAPADGACAVAGGDGAHEFEERAAARASADARAVTDTLRRARGRDYTSDSGASEAVRARVLKGFRLTSMVTRSMNDFCLHREATGVHSRVLLCNASARRLSGHTPAARRCVLRKPCKLAATWLHGVHFQTWPHRPGQCQAWQWRGSAPGVQRASAPPAPGSLFGLVRPQGALPRAQPPTTPRQMLRMTGSTPLHVESRPSMLSSHRIALQQHSGARPCFRHATPPAVSNITVLTTSNMEHGCLCCVLPCSGRPQPVVQTDAPNTRARRACCAVAAATNAALCCVVRDAARATRCAECRASPCHARGMPPCQRGAVQPIGWACMHVGASRVSSPKEDPPRRQADQRARSMQVCST